ncbi:MAG: cobalamin B12-binding domain-containing protein [Thermodesulfobacteriota bacterium]
MSDPNQALTDAMANMREDEAVGVAQQILRSGEDPLKVLEASREAMAIIGKRFEEGEYFLPELILAGEMLKTISTLAQEKLGKGVEISRSGKVLIGTVRGDIHDIGKDIVVFMLDSAGLEVLDLGIDVPHEKFVDAIKEFKPRVLGLSGFLTLAFDSMKSTVDAIREAGLRDQVKIMIGGGQMDDYVKEYCGADAYGADAVAAVSLCRQWIGGE